MQPTTPTKWLEAIIYLFAILRASDWHCSSLLRGVWLV